MYQDAEERPEYRTPRTFGMSGLKFRGFDADHMIPTGTNNNALMRNDMNGVKLLVFHLQRSLLTAILEFMEQYVAFRGFVANASAYGRVRIKGNQPDAAGHYSVIILEKVSAIIEWLAQSDKHAGHNGAGKVSAARRARNRPRPLTRLVQKVISVVAYAANRAIAWYMRRRGIVPVFDQVPYNPDWEELPPLQLRHVATAMGYRERVTGQQPKPTGTQSSPVAGDGIDRLQLRHDALEAARLTRLATQIAITLSQISSIRTLTIYEPTGLLSRSADAMRQRIAVSANLTRPIFVKSHPGDQSSDKQEPTALTVVLVAAVHVHSAMLSIEKSALTSGDDDALEASLVSALIATPNRPDVFIGLPSEFPRSQGFPLFALNNTVIL